MVDPYLVLAIIPKVGASISIPSSSFIIWEAVSDHRKGKGTAIQRALVGMSVVDVCASFAWFLSTWTVPEGTAPLAKGNMASCNFQGFLLQLAVGVSAAAAAMQTSMLWTPRLLGPASGFLVGCWLIFRLLADLPCNSLALRSGSVV